MSLKQKKDRVFDGNKVIADLEGTKVIPRDGYEDRKGEIVAFLNSQETAEEEAPEVPEVPEEESVEEVPSNENVTEIPDSPFKSTDASGHPYAIPEDDKNKLPFGIVLKDKTPKPPKLDPTKGHKTPEFMHWMKKYYPKKFKEVYRGYYARLDILKNSKTRNATK